MKLLNFENDEADEEPLIRRKRRTERLASADEGYCSFNDFLKRLRWSTSGAEDGLGGLIVASVSFYSGSVEATRSPYATCESCSSIGAVRIGGNTARHNGLWMHHYAARVRARVFHSIQWKGSMFENSYAKALRMPTYTIK